MSRLPPLTFEQVRSLFSWDAAALRYRGPSGKFVPASSVREALDQVIATAKREIADLARRMASGELPVSEWQGDTARRLKNLHLASHAAGRGGWLQLTQADYGTVGQTLRFVYSKLAGFAQEAAAGDMSAERIVARSELYGAHATATFEAGRQLSAIDAGYQFERNLLHPADHCDECVEQSLRGWVEIGELVPVGGRTCRVNCRCSLTFAREIPPD